MINECDLTARHLTQLLTFHTHTPIFHCHVTVIRFISSHLVTSCDKSLKVSQFFFAESNFLVINSLNSVNSESLYLMVGPVCSCW